MRGFFRGWVPTLLGYSAQGACKFGFYEFFKKYYSDIVGAENAAKYKTFIYLAGSASAEVIADVALCPMEAVKVRVQTQPGFARGLSDGLPKFVKSEGVLGYETNYIMQIHHQHILFFFLLITSKSLVVFFYRLYKGLVPLWGRQIPCKLKHQNPTFEVLTIVSANRKNDIVTKNRIMIYKINLGWVLQIP